MPVSAMASVLRQSFGASTIESFVQAQVKNSVASTKASVAAATWSMRVNGA